MAEKNLACCKACYYCRISDGVYEAGEIIGSAAMQQAYEMGKGV